MTFLVTRHPGAVEWMHRQGMVPDAILPHLDPSAVSPGDVVIGTLPVNRIAEISARGARYLHLLLDLPFDWRGRELSVGEMESAGARLEEYRAERVPATPTGAEEPCRTAEY